MKDIESRRAFLARTAALAGGAAFSDSIGASKGYGAPLFRKLLLKIKNPDDAIVNAKMPTPKQTGNEFPPSVVTVGGRRWLFIGSNHSVAVPIPTGTHILKDPECAIREQPIYSIGGVVHEIRLGRLPLLYDIPDEQFWRHTYCGAFNVDVMPAGNGHPEWVFSINHCENKNLSWKTKYTRFFTTNSINPADEATETTTSGSLSGQFREYQPAYFGLVSMSYAPVTAETKYGAELFHHDMGAVIWPQTGFMTPDGGAKAPGFWHEHPHPSSLIAEDPRDGKKYIYVFSVISDPDADSRVDERARVMIGAARSPLTERGLPGTYKNYYRGDYTEPSLPDLSGGIKMSRSRKGGKASAIHESTRGCHMNRFFVARLKRSGLFLSVESFRAEGRFQTALRLSEDLRTWTERFVLPIKQRSDYHYDAGSAELALYYPKFLSADGSSHYEIDESERFHIIATNPHFLVYRDLEIQIG